MSQAETPIDPDGAEHQDLESRYVELDIQRRELEEQLNEVVQQMHGPEAKARVEVHGRGGGLERRIMEKWARQGHEQIRIKGLTLYLRNELVGAPAHGMDTMCRAFEESGYGDLVKQRKEVNWQTCKSFLNNDCERDDDGDPVLPTQQLQEAIDVQRRVTLRTRAG